MQCARPGNCPHALSGCLMDVRRLQTSACGFSMLASITHFRLIDDFVNPTVSFSVAHVFGSRLSVVAFTLYSDVVNAPPKVSVLFGAALPLATRLVSKAWLVCHLRYSCLRSYLKHGHTCCPREGELSFSFCSSALVGFRCAGVARESTHLVSLNTVSCSAKILLFQACSWHMPTPCLINGFCW